MKYQLKHCPKSSSPIYPVRGSLAEESEINAIAAFLPLLHHPNISSSWARRRRKKQMGAGGHQLWPVSQVTRLAIVTRRLEPHVYIPGSCSGSVGSWPFTSTPTIELGAKHDVITPIWLGTKSRDWQVVCSLQCLSPPRQGFSNKGHDLPLSCADLWDYWLISRRPGQTEWVLYIQMGFRHCLVPLSSMI